MADMAGFATSRELNDLYFKLKVLGEGLDNPYALFVIGKGFLNGREALVYLEKKIGSKSNERV